MVPLVGGCEAGPPVRFASWMSVTSLTLCAAGASWALWRRPDVFPLDHPMWWATTGTVLGAWLLVALALAGAVTGRSALTFTVAQAPGVLLLSGGLAGRLLFPRTEGTFFGAPFALGVLWVATTFRAYRALEARRRWVLLALSLVVAPLGVVQPWARVPAPPGTRPALLELPPRVPPSSLPPEVTLDDTGRVRLPCGHATLSLQPLLTFQDASDDGFWPLAQTPTTARATETPSLEDGPRRRASLRLAPLDGGALEVDAATLVPTTLASHLSRFTELVAEGLARPEVGFHGTDAPRFEVLPFDYPRGRPVQFGALTAAGDFVVLRASDAEKGPFHELARQPLAREAPLILTLFDDGAPQCRVTWLDFASQADVTLSPTAGEGVPVNVVQFGRPARDEAKVALLLSLAATGIGAGLDTVRYAPGVYRNRVRVEPLSAPR